ncbi:MAG: TonB-dependent receptor plug domain-containing protein [Anaeromyxobacteraceae bacterium]
MTRFHTTRTIRGACAIALLAASTLTHAAAEGAAAERAAAPPDEGDLRALLSAPVEAATRLPQRALEAPSVTSLVTQPTIEGFGWSTLNELLYMQPGFFPSRQYERWTVGSRGLFEPWYNNHVVVLVDGIPFGDAETGSAYTWDLTPLFPWRSVEVVRGPGSALYGSGAMNGVVALTTPSPTKDLERTGYASAKVGDGGRRVYDGMAAADFAHVGVLAAFSRTSTDGDPRLDFDASGRRDAVGALSRFPVRDGRDSTYLLAKFEAKGPLEGLSLQFHHQDWNFQNDHGYADLSPESPDSMREWRDMAILRWRTPGSQALSQDLAVRVQRHGYDYDVRMVPAGVTSGDISYPSGANEELVTHTDELFARAQVAWRAASGASVLGGAEYSGLIYDGDDRHVATFDVRAGGDLAPLPGETAMGPYYAPILGRPVHRVGVYGQAVSGRLLGGLASVTGGARYDATISSYVDPQAPGSPARSQHFEEVSPRLALVVTPSEGTAVKVMAARAFRAPDVAELFPSNTAIQSSNPAGLRPETLDTVELAGTWLVNDHLELRANGYWFNLQNLIGYDGLTVANLYSTEHAGAEVEALWDVDLGRGGRVAGFANWAYAALLHEHSLGPGLEAATRLAWAPAHSAKAGVNYQWKHASVAGTVLFQGPVARRPSDLLTPEYRALRPDVIPAWATVDVNAMWRAQPWLRLGLRVTNLLDLRARVVAPGDLPFDHAVDGRRFLATLVLEP